MTQFVTSFSSAYRQVQSALEGQKAIWAQIKHDQAEGKALPSPQELIHLHQQYEVASDLVIALENLWGVYAQGYEGSESREESEFNEKASLDDLSILLK